MRRPRQLPMLISLALLAVVLVAACGGDDDDGGVTIVGEGGEQLGETSTATIESPTEPPTTESTETPSDAEDATETATPEPTETPSPTTTPEATETATPGSGDNGDFEEISGVPYSVSDVQAAIEGAGLNFLPRSHDPLCPNTSVEEVAFWTAGDSTDYGPTWALWIYPDSEAREAEWEFDDGELEPQTDDCDPPTGFNYFNSNAVLAFVAWTGPDGDSLFDPDRSPGEHPARDAFIEMGGGGDDDDD